MRTATTARDREFTARQERETLESLRRKIERATPEQRLTLLVLIEHPNLLRAVDLFLDELQEGLK